MTMMTKRNFLLIADAKADDERWTNANNALQLSFQNDNKKIEKHRNEIRLIRHNVLKTGFRRLSSSQPRVLVERYEKGGNCSTNPVYNDNNILSEDSMPSSLPNATSCENDGINYFTDIPQAEITDESTINSATTIIKIDPIIEVKEEYPQIEICGNDELITQSNIDNGGNFEATSFIGETNEMAEDSLGVGTSTKLSLMNSSAEQVIHFETSNLSVENVIINEPSSSTTPGDKTNQACLICGTIFRHSWNLKLHLMLVHDQKLGTNWKCGKCNKNFIDKWYLTQHMKNHTIWNPPKKKGFSCSECERRFPTRWHLNRHKIVHNKDKTSMHRGSDEPLISVEEETPKKKGFSCSECERRFHTRWHLKRHMKVHKKVKVLIDGDCDEPLISLEEEIPKRKKSAASLKQFCGTGSIRGKPQSLKINNCFRDAVNAVYMKLPDPTTEELQDPLEISPKEILEIKDEIN